jgi:hypothetical protein
VYGSCRRITLKISIELDDRDWGKVMKALQHELNRARNSDTIYGQREVWPLARIQASMVNQRRGAKAVADIRKQGWLKA